MPPSAPAPTSPCSTSRCPASTASPRPSAPARAVPALPRAHGDDVRSPGLPAPCDAGGRIRLRRQGHPGGAARRRRAPGRQGLRVVDPTLAAESLTRATPRSPSARPTCSRWRAPAGRSPTSPRILHLSEGTVRNHLSSVDRQDRCAQPCRCRPHRRGQRVVDRLIGSLSPRRGRAAGAAGTAPARPSIGSSRCARHRRSPGSRRRCGTGARRRCTPRARAGRSGR